MKDVEMIPFTENQIFSLRKCTETNFALPNFLVIAIFVPIPQLDHKGNIPMVVAQFRIWDFKQLEMRILIVMAHFGLMNKQAVFGTVSIFFQLEKP